MTLTPGTERSRSPTLRAAEVSIVERSMTLMVVGATLLLLAALGYLYLMIRTLARVRHWDVIAAHVAASVGMAILIPTLGLLLALQTHVGLLGSAYLPGRIG